MATEIDYMEYSTDALAQAAYVPNTAVKLLSVDDVGTDNGTADYVVCDKRQCASSGILTKIRVYSLVSGNCKVGIYADSSGEPGSRLTVVNTSTACTLNQWNDIAVPHISLVSGTQYWFVIAYDNAGVRSTFSDAGLTGKRYKASIGYSTYSIPDPAGSGWTTGSSTSTAIAGYGVYLESYSEASIKNQGSYSLKGLAIATNSLNKTLTKTF